MRTAFLCDKAISGDDKVKATTTVVIGLGVLAAGAALSQGTSAEISEADKTTMLASCAVCHGGAGEGNEARSAPRLAGLDVVYLERQLDLFASGQRGTMSGDLFGSQMYVIAQSLKPEDRKAAAIHYASIDAAASPRTLSETAGRGKQSYQACAACHGDDGAGNADIGAPRIAGQADWYILRSLETFHSGARGFDEDDASGQQMRMALDAVDPSEFAAIAAYAASMKAK
jgi:cytochrome c553